MDTVAASAAVEVLAAVTDEALEVAMDVVDSVEDLDGDLMEVLEDVDMVGYLNGSRFYQRSILDRDK